MRVIGRGSLAGIPFEAADGDVLPDGHHAAEASGFVGFLDAVDGQLAAGISRVLSRETLIPVPSPSGRRVAARLG